MGDQMTGVVGIEIGCGELGRGDIVVVVLTVRGSDEAAVVDRHRIAVGDKNMAAVAGWRQT